jgi:endo-1,4-beta-xylanase
MTMFRLRLTSLVLLACLAGCTLKPRPTAAASSKPPVAAAAAAQSSEQALALPSLSERWAPLSLGVAAEPYTLAEQGAVLARHFRRMTAENAMKWGEVCRAEKRCDWTKADTLAAFARQHGMKMTGHAFVWHQMYPAWLFKEGQAPVSKAVLIERMRKHIFQMVERYADVVDNWDVVNEAISDRPGQLWRQSSEQSKWYEAFGSEQYVEVAFRLAAEATARFAPETKLYYNDYSLESAEKRQKALTMVRELRKKGVRIDGVGLQGHGSLVWPSIPDFAKAIDDFAAEGLLVKVSELDVSVYSGDDLEKKVYQKEFAYDANLERQLAERYRALFKLFRDKAPSLSSVTLWGMSDDHTWLNGWPLGRRNYPLLLDRLHQPKLAFRRLLEP